MKKTLVALAVAAVAATSANAAVVYNQDGTKVEVGGQFRVKLTKDSNERIDLKNPGSRIDIKASQDLGNGFSALAATQLRFSARDAAGDEKQDFNDIEAYDVYAGFAYDQAGTLTFGKQASNQDDLGISDYTYDLGDVKQTHNHDDKAAKFRSVEWNGFSFGADYFFGNAKKDSATEQNGKGWGAALFYTAEVANDTTLTVNGGYTKVKNFDRTDLTNNGDYNESAYVVGAELASGPFALAVDWSEKVSTNDTNALDFGTDEVGIDAHKIRALEVGAKYNYLENAKVYGEYQYWKATPNSGDDKVTMNGFILGTDYWFTKQVVTYLEAGTFKYKNQDDKSDRDNKIGVGFRVYF
ncbi:membrane protein [Gallibacterium anatis]|uniref:porin n=1 Tax=Gallibacterium anatis TaxID=750 RepID=UPI000531AE64|nr:porin [Gallibacterium anatis]KGQ43347.1 membrane protein [Gallibacterium anatis]KGQ48276.1 membrane protein [Gallibacterium anatis]KGQ56747.1 membrane protein [Gallibacterium anatis]